MRYTKVGVWRESDFLSHLHIEDGEDIVIILVKKRKYPYHKSVACCNIYDLYDEFGIPVHGKYDECGGLFDIKNADDVIKFLNRFEYVVAEHSAENVEFPLTAENLDKFLQAVAKDDVSVYGSLISRMYINERLYNRLIDDYKQRAYTKDGRIYTNEDIVESACVRCINGIEKDMNESSFFRCITPVPNKEVYFRCTFCDYLDSKFRSLCVSDYIESDSVIPYLLRKMYEGDEKDVCLAYVKELLFFSWVLESMRSGYLCISGSGGDMCEMWLQKILAEYILERCNERVTEYREENVCDENDTDEHILKDGVTDILFLSIP